MTQIALIKLANIAASYGAEVVQFNYAGGWPKKRQYILDTYQFRTKWVLLLDADEILTDAAKHEILKAIQTDHYDR